MENRAFYPNHLRNASVYCGERLINSGDGRLEKDKREAKTSLRDKTVGGYRNRPCEGKERERETEERERWLLLLLLLLCRCRSRPKTSEPQTCKWPKKSQNPPNILNVLFSFQKSAPFNH